MAHPPYSSAQKGRIRSALCCAAVILRRFLCQGSKSRACRLTEAYRAGRYAPVKRQAAHKRKRGKGDAPRWGQPVLHFLVNVGISIARVVFQRPGAKCRYVTLVMLQDCAHGFRVAARRCCNNRERQQGNGFFISVHLFFPPYTV